MRDYHQKEPRIEPPRDFCTSLGAFVFDGVDVEKEDFAHDRESFLSLGEPGESNARIGENDPCQIM
jgi:hypothetical protein